MRTLRRPPAPPPPLQRLGRPPVERFAEYRRRSQPVLLDGLTDDWPDRDSWSLASLRERFADRPVSASPMRNGRMICDARTGLVFETIRFGDYIDRLERGELPDAYANGAGDRWLPELSDTVRTPEYCRTAAWQTSRFWLSAANMSSPLHRHGAENIFVQLVGRKRFYLYPPAATPWLYSNPMLSALPNYSRFDPEVPDEARFPLVRAVRPLEVVLHPGDAVYFPSGWWHQARSLDVSLSVNFFFADGALALAQRATEVAKRLRGLEIYGLEQRLRSPGATPGSAVVAAVPDAAREDRA